jgi:DNA-binding PadR family transcriptional regulator
MTKCFYDTLDRLEFLGLVDTVKQLENYYENGLIGSSELKVISNIVDLEYDIEFETAIFDLIENIIIKYNMYKI